MYAYKRKAETIDRQIVTSQTKTTANEIKISLDCWKFYFSQHSLQFIVYFYFFRALKKNKVFFQSNVKFSLTYSHSLFLSIPSIDQLTLNGGPLRKSRDSKCADTNQK